MVTLQSTLRMNASTCIGFGLLFSLIPDSVAHFLSATSPAPSLVLLILGLGLIFQGAHLFWASLQIQPSKALILYFSLGDFAWMLASVFLMLLGVWVNSPLGVLYASLVALMVGFLGVMQIKTYKKEHCPST